MNSANATRPAAHPARDGGGGAGTKSVQTRRRCGLQLSTLGHLQHPACLPRGSSPFRPLHEHRGNGYSRSLREPSVQDEQPSGLPARSVMARPRTKGCRSAGRQVVTSAMGPPPDRYRARDANRVSESRPHALRRRPDPRDENGLPRSRHLPGLETIRRRWKADARADAHRAVTTRGPEAELRDNEDGLRALVPGRPETRGTLASLHLTARRLGVDPDRLSGDGSTCRPSHLGDSVD